MQRARMSLLSMTVKVTSALLGALGVLHVLWGRGSTFPFRTREDLNDHVVGQQVTPSPPACYAVAALLATGAVSVDRARRRGTAASRAVAAACSLVLAGRAVLGVAGRTDLAVPGSTSERFRRNDRRLFAPLCAALAFGSAVAANFGAGTSAA